MNICIVGVGFRECRLQMGSSQRETFLTRNDYVDTTYGTEKTFTQILL